MAADKYGLLIFSAFIRVGLRPIPFIANGYFWLTGAAVSGMLNGAQFTVGAIRSDLARKQL